MAEQEADDRTEEVDEEVEGFMGDGGGEASGCPGSPGQEFGESKSGFPFSKSDEPRLCFFFGIETGKGRDWKGRLRRNFSCVARRVRRLRKTLLMSVELTKGVREWSTDESPSGFTDGGHKEAEASVADANRAALENSGLVRHK